MSDDREIEELQAELDAVLSDWNAIVKASGSPTHGTAIGHVAAMRAEVERLRAELKAVDSALGGTPTIVWDNSPTRAESVRELGEEVARLRGQDNPWRRMAISRSERRRALDCNPPSTNKEAQAWDTERVRQDRAPSDSAMGRIVKTSTDYIFALCTRAEFSERAHRDVAGRLQLAARLLNDVVIKDGCGHWTAEQRNSWCSDLKDFQNGAIEIERDHEIATLQAEIARLRAERQWQPMETAPRDDNTEVLVVFKATGYVSMAVWRRHEESWLYSNEYKDEGELRSCYDADLGGWMPLPKPPEQEP